MIRVFSRGNFFWVDLLDFGSLLYLPVIFYLLFKRRRWGWILLFADNLGSLLLRLRESYMFFKFQPIHHGSTISFIAPILLWTAFAFFLWRDGIPELFKVDTMTKKKTVWITLAGTFLLMGLLYLPLLGQQTSVEVLPKPVHVIKSPLAQ